MENVVELQNVEKEYDLDTIKLKVLNGINLKIKKSETVGIMGPSGSGKSTMLHLLGCLDRPTKGKVIVDGIDVSKLDENNLAKIRREKIGFIFQFFYLIPSLTALRNVELPMTFVGDESREREKKAKELLNMVGLEGRMNHRPSQLSGGESQRVAIARAIANDPQIILADEPTGNLDSASGKEIIELLVNLNKEKKVTLITVTHDPNIAKHMKRIINLKDGKILRDE